MEWDAQRRVYVTDDGEEVSPAQVRQFIDGFIGNAQNEIDSESNDLLTGAITVAAFFAFLGSLITSMHIASSLIAYGGEDEMNGTRWSRVDERLSSELAYLEAFKSQVIEAEKITESLAVQVGGLVPEESAKVSAAIIDAIRAEGRADIVATVDGALESIGVVESEIGVGSIIDSFGERIESIIWGEIESRSRSYAGSSFATYENNVRERETDAGAVGVAYVCEDDESSCESCPTFDTHGEYISMEEVTDVGSGECGPRCRCYYLFEYLNVEPLEIDREIYGNNGVITIESEMSE